MFSRVLLFLLFLVPSYSSACIVAAGRELSDIFAADAVVLGTVRNYQIVDVGARGPLPNYAFFDVLVGEVLVGDISERINENGFLPVTWDNSTYGEPETLGRMGGYLFALRDPSSAQLPLRSGSGVVLPSPEPDTFTLLQAPCAGAFIFEAEGPTSILLQQVLETERDPENELEILEEFVKRRPYGATIQKLDCRLYAIEQGIGSTSHCDTYDRIRP